ncbi:hypothetical protein DL96DRAFT_1629930, partial [Flagelloscypha sp. PMI_526]
MDTFDSFERTILDLVARSPVPELLADTSVVPTFEQTRSISKHITSLSDSLDYIQEIIRRSNALKDKLEACRKMHEGLNSGIRTLPAEILSEVFCNIYDVIESEGYHKMLQTQVLASVCRQWRNVALGCAALWLHQSRKGSGQLDWGYPLNIVVSWPSYKDLPIPAHALQALDLLVAERQRWTSLQISLRDGATLPPFVAMEPETAGSLPLLRSLDIIGNTRRSRVALADYGFFHDAPRLESLYVFYAPPPSTVPASWANLQVFRTSDTIVLLAALTVVKREMDDPRHQTDPEQIANEVIRLLSLPSLESDQELLTLLPAFLNTSTQLRQSSSSSITSDQPFSLISCLFASPTARPVPRLKSLRYHLFVDDWAEYNTDPQGQPAIFCMICIAALEKVTEEVIASRYEQAPAVDQLEELYVHVDRVKGLVKPGKFLGGVQEFVKERGLKMAVRFRDVEPD